MHCHISGRLLRVFGVELSTKGNLNALATRAALCSNPGRDTSTVCVGVQSSISPYNYAEGILQSNLHSHWSSPESAHFWPASICALAPSVQVYYRQAHSAANPTRDGQHTLLSQSHVIGPTDIPLLETTIGQKFTDTATDYSSHIALISRQENVRYTYDELHRRVTALASGFARLGLAKGDRLGLFSPNHAAWVVTQFAAAKLGLILVNLNPGYQSLELHQTVRKVGCRAIVVADKYKGKSMMETCERALQWNIRGGRGRVRSEEVPSLEYILTLGEISTVASSIASSCQQMAMILLFRKAFNSQPYGPGKEWASNSLYGGTKSIRRGRRGCEFIQGCKLAFWCSMRAGPSVQRLHQGSVVLKKVAQLKAGVKT